MVQAGGNGMGDRSGAPGIAAAQWRDELARAVEAGDAATAARPAGEVHPADLAGFVLNMAPAARSTWLLFRAAA